ncbi:MAG: hypothetical protein ACXAD7_18490 [Candidatus Kariarchaeaceae archaeon]|jgi:hypothetical protein
MEELIIILPDDMLDVLYGSPENRIYLNIDDTNICTECERLNDELSKAIGRNPSNSGGRSKLQKIKTNFKNAIRTRLALY